MTRMRRHDPETRRPRHSPRSRNRLVPVTFELPAWTAGRHAELVAEFALWTPLAMDRSEDGSHRLTVMLARGRRWGYQFVVDGDTTINDPYAGCYARTPSGFAVSVVHV
jgi:1,4-alpha-glucan branching enzyme